MAVVVRIPTVLRKLTGGLGEVPANGGTVADVLSSLGSTYPDLIGRIMEDGQVRPFLNVFVNGEDIRFTGDANTAVKEGDEVSIIPSVAGGR